jgi:arylsulfatase A-like enzyme
VTSGHFQPEATVGSNPNVILIIIDDLSWDDVGFYEGLIETPNIDRLAGEGVVLERMYQLIRDYDLYPTLQAAAGLRVEGPAQDAVNVRPVLEGGPLIDRHPVQQLIDFGEVDGNR